MILLAPRLLGISILEAAVMGTVVAAVSPAVIVPRMLSLIDNGYGKKKSIPQMIMAAASVDDVFVIILFTTFSGLLQGGDFSARGLLAIPTSIILGIIGGIISGLTLNMLFNRIPLRATAMVLIILSISFLLVTLEYNMKGSIGFLGLLAVMALGAVIKIKNTGLSEKLSSKFSKLWVCAEVLLFVLVGATVNISYAINAGGIVVVLILLVTLFRILGVILSLVGTNLNNGERLFCAFSFIPKATVQAAIGALPLAMGLSCGEIVLTVAVVSILINAPLGAMLIDMNYKRLLTSE